MTPRPRGAARREALLQAVLQVVAESGADAVTHRRVAEVAELPLASTTYWFRSKEEMLTEALRHAADRDVARLRRAADGSPATPEAIADLLPGEDTPGDRAAAVAVYALMLEAARRPGLQALSRGWTDAYVETCAALLSRAGSSDPPGDARLLMAAADGLLLDALAGGEHPDHRPPLTRLARALIGAGAR